MNRFGATRANMLIISVAYGIFALSLLFQSHRWSATPAYHNLLEIMPAKGWGGVFAATAGLLGVSVWKHPRRWLAIVALTVAIAVTTGWGGDFIVRWLTSTSTTPETWVSWGVFDYMLLRAAARLDIEEVVLPKRRGKPDG